MNVVTLILRWPGILIGVLFMVAVLTACSDSTGSTPPTNGDYGAWDEYEAFCSEAAQKELDDNEDYTNEEVSTFYAGLVERMESIDPPVEIADWHDKVLAGWTAVKRLIDSEPQDAIFNPLMLFSDSEILSLFGEVEEAFNEIPADVRERLAAVGCSDDADSQATGAGESDTPWGLLLWCMRCRGIEPGPSKVYAGRPPTGASGPCGNHAEDGTALALPPLSVRSPMPKRVPVRARRRPPPGRTHL